MKEDRFLVFFGALATAAVVILAGCNTTLEPFDDETGQFSIYGALTLSKEQHFIRVKDLNEPVVQGSTRVLDATVTLENLETGTKETLADSIVTFDGIATHNFRSEQEIQPKATYRLTVERPDERASQATATMPPRTKVEVEPIKTDTVSCTQGIRFNFRNVSDARLLTMTIAVYWEKRWRWVEINASSQFGILPWRIVEEVVPQHILDTLPDSSYYCTLLDDNKLRMPYTHFGPDWPADSVLADPTESTVENGLGVFGGIHQDTLVRTIDTSREGATRRSQ